MDPLKQTTNYAELGAGFLAGLNPVSALVQGLIKVTKAGSPPSILLKLTNPEKKILITPGQIPIVKMVDGADPDVNMIVTLEAEMFHFLLWGKLTMAKALNEKLLLMEYMRNMPPQDKPVTAIAGGPLHYNNFIYEMFLIRSGAGRLITEKTAPDFPLPGEVRPVKEIPLDPVQTDSLLLGPIANALAWGLGALGGLGLRLFLGWLLKEDLDAPPEYSEVPDPRPPLPPASSGIRLALMKLLFKKINILAVFDHLAKGMLATGPFN